jgi:hypothetical protein
MATAARYPKTVYNYTGRRNTANYSGIEKTSTNTNYSYAKPTEKQQHGLAKNCGTDIQNYELPLCDVDIQRRNFPGYTEAKVYSIEDIVEGDRSGSTDTDYNTHQNYGTDRSDSGYTRINKKSGGKGRSWKTTSPQKGIN